MQSAHFINTRNDIQVCVPDSPGLMTPYVLREQHDWFEDEIHFVRKLVRPGMQVIDIGANYGLYTLNMAKGLGSTGRLWAFEPAQATAGYLQESITRNGFENIQLIQAGLSDRLGTASFFTAGNAELSSLTQDSDCTIATETIELLTLDHCLERYHWADIDFIKLDAEGEEGKILDAGKKALATLSPLIMFELKHGSSINTSLIEQFQSMDYLCYRLVPGLNVLIPFKNNQAADGFLLNLFCCKEDRARQLERDGFLVAKWDTNPVADMQAISDHLGRSAYGQLLQSQLQHAGKQDMDEFRRILGNYLISCSESVDTGTGTGHLLAAAEGLRAMLDAGEMGFSRLISFARIAFDAGERTLGVRILDHINNQPVETIRQQPIGLCLPACSRYDDIAPVGDDLHTWLLASGVEQYIIKHHFSSYFTRAACLPLFQRLEEYGYLGKDMSRRWQLVREVSD